MNQIIITILKYSLKFLLVILYDGTYLHILFLPILAIFQYLDKIFV